MALSHSLVCYLNPYIRQCDVYLASRLVLHCCPLFGCLTAWPCAREKNERLDQFYGDRKSIRVHFTAALHLILDRHGLGEIADIINFLFVKTRGDRRYVGPTVAAAVTPALGADQQCFLPAPAYCTAARSAGWGYHITRMHFSAESHLYRNERTAVFQFHPS